MKTLLIATVTALSFTSTCFSQTSLGPRTKEEIEAVHQRILELKMPLLEGDSAYIGTALQKTNYSGGEDVMLQITFKNVGTKAFGNTYSTLDDKVYNFFDIDVTNQTNMNARLLPIYDRSNISSGEPEGWQFAPGQMRKATVWLNNLFDLTFAGKYKVTVSKKFRQDGKTITVGSEPIEFEIDSGPPIAEWN